MGRYQKDKQVAPNLQRLNDWIARVGGVNAAGRLCGLHPSTVSNIVRGKYRASSEVAERIEEASTGDVSADELRPASANKRGRPAGAQPVDPGLKRAALHMPWV